ncbi:MAG: hypothetical protein DRQ08_01185 [Candidatus Latescibacterota bacterium]|nr:MAG: hypothetical protein DRQ08_01185 [Candidatus Latescibacterota bacterium]
MSIGQGSLLGLDREVPEGLYLNQRRSDMYAPPKSRVDYSTTGTTTPSRFCDGLYLTFRR